MNSSSVFTPDGVKNSPGMCSYVPKTISAAETLMSGLYAARSPSNASGSLLDHFSVSSDIRAAFSVRWKRSMIPLACG